METPDERVLTQEVWGPHFQRRFRVVVIQVLDHHGQVQASAVLCSTDPAMKPLDSLALYRARFEIETGQHDYGDTSRTSSVSIIE